MSKFLLSGKSRPGQFLFKQVLKAMESSFRYRFNDPQKLIKASGIQAGQTILEVGCGSGFFTTTLSDIVGEHGLVQSIDFHPMAVEATKRKIQLQGKQNVRVCKADAHQTDFPNASFDTIILYGVVPAPVISEKQLSLEMYRLLKPGGILAIWTVAPFWKPKSFIQTSQLGLFDKRQGVYRLQKLLS